MNREKTLYITDLDGTLVRNDLTVSDYTAKTINNLIDNGMIFSFATARSIVTAGDMTSKIKTNIPVVVHNGVFIMEKNTEKILHGNFFDKTTAGRILKVITSHHTTPMVHEYTNGKEKLTFCPGSESKPMREFLDTRKADKRYNPVKYENLIDGNVFHFTCIDDKEILLNIRCELENEFQCIYYTDMYTGNIWLEIQPKCASKGEAVKQLKEMLGCTKIVCFGDGVNDIPMFEIADESYAVANAEEELKKYATAIIDSNTDDGVAKWLIKNYNTQGE